MAEHPSEREVSPERSPWSRASVLLSGAFLLALVLAGILVAATSGGGHGTVRSRPLSGARRAAPAPRSAGAARCALASGDQRVPWSSPPPARWGTVGSMAVPQSPAVFGPQHSSGPWNTCFAHNPGGALLAAVNVWAEATAVAPGALFQRLAVGAPRDLGNNDQLDSGGPVQFAGYRYLSYTPAQALVDVVVQGPRGALAAVLTPMVWRAGDWKYVFPAQGVPPIEVIPDLAGYVPWSSF
jgi:hypothetical protein